MRQDFLNLYTGARLALEGRWGELHDQNVQMQVERALAPGRTELVPFVRPHLYAALLAPMALLPLAPAFWIWTALQALLYLLCGWAAWRRFGAEGLALWAIFPALPLNLVLGQDGCLFLAVALAGWLLAEKDRPALAGAVWSLGLFKFHLLAGLVIGLAAGRRWRILGGFAVGAFAFAAASSVLAGPAGLRAYLALLTDKTLAGLSPGRAQMTCWEGLTANLAGGAWLAAAAVALCLVLAVLCAWRAPLWRVVAAGLPLGLYMAPHVYLYDLSSMLLCLLLASEKGRPPVLRSAAFLLAGPYAFGMLLLDPPWAVVRAFLIPIFLAVLAASAKQREEARTVGEA
jgi:hypothetical protein